jgi:hypothetical protein
VIYSDTNDPEARRAFAELRRQNDPTPPPIVTAPPAVNDPPDPAAADAERRETQDQDEVASRLVAGPDGILRFADSPYAISDAPSPGAPQAAPQAIGGNYVASYDVETGKWDVVNLATGLPVQTGLTEQQAILDAQNLSVGDPGYGNKPPAFTGVAYYDNGF